MRTVMSALGTLFFVATTPAPAADIYSFIADTERCSTRVAMSPTITMPCHERHSKKKPAARRPCESFP